MAKHPQEMSIEELRAHYGEPKRLATITSVLGVMSNDHHDRTTVEVTTDSVERLELQFTQSALRELLLICRPEADAQDKPRAN